jgi:hypothetical protein
MTSQTYPLTIIRSSRILAQGGPRELEFSLNLSLNSVENNVAASQSVLTLEMLPLRSNFSFAFAEIQDC